MITPHRKKELLALSHHIEDHVIEQVERYHEEILFEAYMSSSRGMTNEERSFLAGVLDVTP